MNLFREAADIQDRANQSPIAIALIALLVGYFTHAFYWRDDPYRDGAETFIRTDDVTVQNVGEIRRINLKRVVGGGCTPSCNTSVFAVVGTRAIALVAVKSWQGPTGKPEFGVQSRS